LQNKNELLQNKNDSLQNQLDAIIKMLNGKKSEKRTDSLIDQLSLFGDPVISKQDKEEEEETVTRTQKKRKEKPARKPLPENLRREIIEIYPDNIPEGSKCIGEEVTEVLEIVAAEVFVKRFVRYKYALPNDTGVITGKRIKYEFCSTF